MKVLVAGGGRVALALEAAFGAAGVRVARWSRSDGLVVGGAEPAGAPDVAVLAVSDRAIGEVAERLLADGLVAHSTVLLHTAGAVPPAAAFASVRGLVAGTGMMHPLRAIAGGPSDARFAGVVFGVAGDEAGVRAASDLVGRLGGRVLRLSGDDGLARYHAAAVLASNHALALVDAAAGLLVAEGLPRREAEQALSALVASAAANVAALGLPEALTGPIARGDAETVARHLRALPPAERDLYRSSALATVAVARRKRGAPEAALDRIARLLVEDSPAPSG